MSVAARGHMPFKGHRNQQQVREDQEEHERQLLIRKLERELTQARRTAA